MSDNQRVHTTKVMNRSGGAVSALQGFNALNEIVNAAHECIAVHQVESTKRKRIAAYEATEVQRIKAAESILRDYFAQVFAERRSNFEAMFTRLDDALEAQDGETVHLMVKSIVDIAKTSPLADLGDLSKIRAALDDPDQVWEL
ncbi:hypothetical protein [Mycobacterium sp. ACS4331]|uniref:hypothetical protein n=1 Tax=Mycobacterium sp. ACS4331 TaxID=1834121 RepID=UPI0007FE6D74|nr:hypothetical protein [Mycobacterium sp. ACS4331]OBF29763.1 hypothetical protein A5727_23120 [Mycobacterium sp. ACS4331]